MFREKMQRTITLTIPKFLYNYLTEVPEVKKASFCISMY